MFKVYESDFLSWSFIYNIIITGSHGLEYEMELFHPRLTFSIRNEACRVSDERKCKPEGGIASSHIIDHL